MSCRTLVFLVAVVASVATGTFVSAADTPDPRLAGYRTPPGWKVELAATEPMVINPVTMTWGPDNRLYVIEWKEGRGPNDHIKALSDTDGDGVFDKVEMYMEGFDLPAGIAFWDGWTYITLDHDVVRFRDPDLDGKYEKREVIATGFGNDDSHHRVSGLVFGPDGWLYMTTGDSDARAKGSDGSSATVLRCGGVFRCLPDGSKLENVAFGMRNPWGNIAFDDEFRIFHTDNDNEGAQGFTGCRLLHVVQGGDYGWRLREGARCCVPDYDRATWNGGRPGRLGWMAETGRGAPAGLCILNSAAFPPSLRNLVVYPDVFRKSVRAYTLKPRGATFDAVEKYEILASDEGLFRPTDAEIGPDGALYILDWRTDSGGAGKLSGNATTGRIYRMTWGGTPSEPAMKTLDRERFTQIPSDSDLRLVERLESDDYLERIRSNHELIRRGLTKNHRLASTLPDSVVRNLKSERGALLLNLLLTQKPLAQLHAQAIEAALGSIEKGRPTPLRLGIDPEKPPAEKINAEILIQRFAEPSDRVLASRVLLRAIDSEPLTPELASAVGRFRGLGRGKLDEAKQKLFFGDRSTRDNQILYLKGMLFLAELKQAAQEKQDLLAALRQDHAQNRVNDEDFQSREQALKQQIVKGQEQITKFEGRIKSISQLAGVSEVVVPQNAASVSYEDKILLAPEIEAISTDVLAAFLAKAAVRAKKADAFTRDGIARGLDNLGEAGIDALMEVVGGKEASAEDRKAAMETVVACRKPDSLGRLLDLTIGPDGKGVAEKGYPALPDGAYEGIFRAVREFGSAVPSTRIAAFLANFGDGEPGATSEAIRVLSVRPDATKALAPAIPRLVNHKDGGVRKAALALAPSAKSDEAKKALIAFVSDREKSSDERRQALAALRAYEDKNLAATLKEVLANANDPALMGEALRTLGSVDFAAAAEFAESALASPESELRREAIALMGQKPETALIVAKLYNAGKLPKEDLSRVVESVRNHSTAELQEATQQILKATLLAAPKGAEAARLREFVDKNGDPERGKSIYLDARRGNCATCHRMEGSGGSVGPDLTRIWETLSFDKRVESILEPSKEIKEGFNTVKVATKDGRVSVGLLVAKTGDSVTLKDAQGREVRIPSAEVEEVGNDQTSLMPAGVVGHLSFGELADLLKFLGDRKTQEAMKK